MIHDRATRLLPSERAGALLLAVAVLRGASARVAAELLYQLVFATTVDTVYGATYGAVLFATASMAAATS